MTTKIVKKLYDFRESDSWAADLRRKRFALFEFFIESVPGFLKILDVGGTQEF